MTRARIGMLAVLLLALAGVLYAQDDVSPAPAGTWKLTLPTVEETDGLPIVLVKFDKHKDGKWEGTVVAAIAKFGFLKKAEVEKVSVSDKAWKFTIKSPQQTLICEVNLGKDTKAKTFYGEERDRERGDAKPLEVERTTMTSL